jgi:hypothetical protein
MDGSHSIEKTGQYWDPLGEYEYRDTIYEVSVYVPARPLPRYWPSIFARKSIHTSPHHAIPSHHPPKYSNFTPHDLEHMECEVIKIKAKDFPYELRCQHVRKNNRCSGGCYFLEKGDTTAQWKCKRLDCKGHVYGQNVKKHNDVACFGKKGDRMVFIKPGHEK